MHARRTRLGTFVATAGNGVDASVDCGLHFVDLGTARGRQRRSDEPEREHRRNEKIDQQTTVLHEMAMAGETGLEPATSGVTGRRSNQLSYSPASVAEIRPIR